MSDVQNTIPTAETPAVEPALAEHKPEVISTTEDLPKTEHEAPVTESKPEESTTEAAAAEEKKDEVAPAEKVVEPISEGQLAYKGPGLLKSLIPSKKEFWLSDEATSSHDLSSYLRGEKPEISHPVVAWASQTGKGLLFFNKKGDTTRKQPGHVLALYDATDLKKQSPHEIVFKLNGHEHTLKATSDAERDGWYMSLEKSVELGKASKEETVESEGYKAELEKLNKPHVTAAAAAAKRSQSQPKKSDEADAPKRANSDAEEDKKKTTKSRSTSRGVFNRLKGKKDEDSKKEESKTEDAAEDHKTEEIAAAGAGGAAVVGGAAALEGSSEDKTESPETPSEAVKTEEKTSKPAKRGSIFGKFGAWSKTPTKEKEPKEAELRPETAGTDESVADKAPVLPETATTEHTNAEAEANKIEAKADEEVAKENATEEPKEELSTPNKEKPKFLSGLSFMNKRNRSVSPSQVKTESEAPKENVSEPIKAEEAPIEPVAAPEAAESVEKPTEKVEEPAKGESSTPNKRQSFIGSLGRRASKAMGYKKKENVAPATETKDESAEPATEDVPKVNGELKSAELEQPQQTIGDVVPDAINVGQPQTVTASA